VLSEESIKTYRDEGVVCLRGLFDPTWLRLLETGIERNLQARGPNARHYNAGRDTGFYFADAGVWQKIPEYREFLFQSPAAAIAARLMDARKVNLFFDNVFIKDASTPETTPWHHDLPYMPIDGDQVCSMWLALDEVPIENSVEYIAGSHLWGKQFRPRNFFNPTADYNPEDFSDSRLEPTPDFDAARDQVTIRRWAMKPGDVQVFHALTVHGSPGNSTLTRRRAFVSRWCGDDVRYAWKGPETYPVFKDCGLLPGDELDSDTFPVVLNDELNETEDFYLQ